MELYLLKANFLHRKVNIINQHQMAENKKSFVMYCDLIHTIEKLSDENAGKLLKHLFRYVNDQNPIPENEIVDLVFEPIKHQFKRDLFNWGVKITERSLAGRMGNIKRWNPDLFEKISNGKMTLEEAEKIAINRKTSLSDKTVANVAVNDNVTVNVNVNDIKENNGDFAFDVFWSLYPKKVERKDCERIFNKLSSTDKQKIKNTLSSFISYKPFTDYTHPNPKTYLNKQRWNDEIPLANNSNLSALIGKTNQISKTAADYDND